MRLHISNLGLVLFSQTIFLFFVAISLNNGGGTNDNILVEAIASNEKFNKRIQKFASSSSPLVFGARAPISFSVFSDKKADADVGEGTKEEGVVIEDGNKNDDHVTDGVDESDYGIEIIGETIETFDDHDNDYTAGPIDTASDAASESSLKFGEEISDLLYEEDEEENDDDDDQNDATTCSSVGHSQNQLGRVAVPAILAGASLFGVSKISSPSSSSRSQSKKVAMMSSRRSIVDVAGNADAPMKANNNNNNNNIKNNDELSEQLTPVVTILKVAFACLVASKI